MTRIGGIGSLGTDQLRVIRRIQELGQAISQNQVRLSTLKRINSAKDDPAGLIRVSIFEQELAAAEAASKSITRASAILGTADKAAGDILTQLQAARTQILAAASSTSSASEKAAAQIEIDTIVQGINMLAKTEFAGTQLLTGASGFSASGYDNTTTLDIDILGKQTADDVTVTITVDSTATQATNSYTSGALGSDTTLIIAGPDGTTTIDLSSADSTQTVTDAFNAVSYLTGIEATRIDGNQIDFKTADYGSNATLSITASAGSFDLSTSSTTTGTDATATINGTSVTGDGSTFNVNTSDIALVVELDPTASGAITPFTISGTGLSVVIGSSPGATARIGLPNLLSSGLGGVTGALSSITSGGANTVTGGKAAEALRIVDDAIDDVTKAQAVIGSFQKYTLDSSSNVLSSQKTNLASALSAIQDTDIALETALLVNNQLLQQSAFQALSISATNNKSILSLLRNSIF